MTEFEATLHRHGFHVPARNPFSVMTTGRFWRRHPKPFAKTRRGMLRRAERKFVLGLFNNRLLRLGD